MNLTQSLSKEEMQVIWIIGACERMEGLGLMKAGCSSIDKEAIDVYLEIDEHRDELFDSFENFAEIVVATIMADTNAMIEKNIQEGHDSRSSWELMGCKNQEEQAENIANIVMCLAAYLKNRERLVQYALNSMMNKES